jgi:hypothetical protein
MKATAEGGCVAQPTRKIKQTRTNEIFGLSFMKM